jgi:predicted transcriptional regulator
MKSLSLKLDDEIFETTEKLLARLKKSRNRYINEALHFYNKLHERRLLEQRYQKASKTVTADSMSVLEEFERLQDDPAL